MQSRTLKLIYRILNTEISLKKFYYFLIKYFTGLNAFVNQYPLFKFCKKIRDLDIRIRNIATREFSPVCVLIRQRDISCEANFDKTVNPLKIANPSVFQTPSIYSMVNWRYHNVSISAQYRSYALYMSTKINDILSKDFSLKTKIKVEKIDEDLIELDRRIRITEEIIELCPYVRKLSQNKLYKVPVFKKPLQKSYFSEEQINNFKELLAKQGKTRKSNIEILYIYDKLNIDYYSSIKQDSESKSLVCCFNNKIEKNDQRNMCYLIIGHTKNTKEMIKALAMSD